MNQLKNWHALNILFEYYHLLRPSSCRLSIIRLMFLFRNFNHFSSLTLPCVCSPSLQHSFSQSSNFKLLICMSLFVCTHIVSNSFYSLHACTNALLLSLHKQINQPQYHTHIIIIIVVITTFCIHTTICVTIGCNSIILQIINDDKIVLECFK